MCISANVYIYGFDLLLLIYMGRIDIILPDDLEQEFRTEVFKQLGMKRGNITLAIIDAIQRWMKEQQKKRSNAAKKAWDTRKKEENK
jgi:hypothetical protein